MSSISGTPSPAQLAVMEQIRALRAAKTATPVQATTHVQATTPVQAKPAAARPAMTQPPATASSMPANRPRGSILNIIA
jgi:hypothetical protein